MSDLSSNLTKGLASSGLAQDRRAAVNRANAQHSTGSRIDAGQQRTSLRPLRHGFSGHVMVLPAEDHPAYEALTRRFFDHFQPEGAFEEQLVQSLVNTSWQLNRIAAFEVNLLSLGATTASICEQIRALANLSMHEQRLSLRFERTLKQFREIKTERLETE